MLNWAFVGVILVIQFLQKPLAPEHQTHPFLLGQRPILLLVLTLKMDFIPFRVTQVILIGIIQQIILLEIQMVKA